MQNNKLVKTSVFKQEVHRKVYELYSGYETDMRSFIMHYHINDLVLKSEKISESEIFKCDLEMPLLNAGEEFYIEELDKTVKILKRVRTSKENVCYYVEPELIEDEETKRTKELAEQTKLNYEMHKDELDNYKRERNELKNFKEKVEGSFWFKFMKIED